ncbi:hypothetical protein B0H14DRAFT_3521224 [Mycena olivaceomarginata]|nr:hypothetical protein B0H14DRAFT_3521224 [Mycena olivaceomarginata]
MSLAVLLPFVSLATSYNPLTNWTYPLLLNIWAGTTPAALPPRPHRTGAHPSHPSLLNFIPPSVTHVAPPSNTDIQWSHPLQHPDQPPALSTLTLTVSNTVLYE